MNATVERFANEAVFVLQFNSREATNYVRRNAQVSETEAAKAIKQVATFHKR
jgi:hypothetical protein